MADKTIGDLTVASALTGAELLEAQQDGNSRHLSLSAITSWMKANAAQFLANTAGFFLTTDQVWASGAPVAVT